MRRLPTGLALQMVGYLWPAARMRPSSLWSSVAAALVLFDQAAAQCMSDRRGAACDAELGVDVFEVGA